jgi:DNA mismatch repair protein MutH
MKLVEIMIAVVLALFLIAVACQAGEFEDGVFWAVTEINRHLPDNMRQLDHAHVLSDASEARTRNEIEKLRREADIKAVEMISAKEVRIVQAETDKIKTIAQTKTAEKTVNEIVQLKKAIYALQTVLIANGIIEAGCTADHLIKKYDTPASP